MVPKAWEDIPVSVAATAATLVRAAQEHNTASLMIYQWQGIIDRYAMTGTNERAFTIVSRTPQGDPLLSLQAFGMITMNGSTITLLPEIYEFVRYRQRNRWIRWGLRVNWSRIGAIVGWPLGIAFTILGAVQGIPLLKEWGLWPFPWPP